MQIIIHRGTHQIGGCITEIATASSRIFIDMGDNLPGLEAPLTEAQKQALVESLCNHNKRTHEAVIYTHGHFDHVGMLEYVPASMEQYMSQGTKDILLLKEEVLQKGLELGGRNADENRFRIQRIRDCKTWQRPPHRHKPQSWQIGDIKITPFFVSHSIFDAHMLLIEAEGKKVLHTGDYRGHGYISKGLFPTLQHYIKQVDVLITEGTMLNQEQEVSPEWVISQRMEAMMRKFKYVFVLASATDIERLMTIENAARKANRLWVTCSLLLDKTLKYFTSFDGGQTQKLFNSERHKLSPSKPKRKLLKDMQDKGFAMVVGAGHSERVEKIMQNFDPEKTLLIYSAWDGYYQLPEQIETNPGYSQMRSLFKNVVDIHTSGHADRKTIEKVIKTVHPREAIIGIHKEANASLGSLNLPEELKDKIVPDRLQLDYITTK